MATMRTAILATVGIAVCATQVVCATQAWAIDLQIRSSLSQTLEINDNRNMSVNSAGVTYAPVSSLVLDVLARTPTMRFEASGNLDYRTFFGPGAVNTNNALDRGARAKLTKTTRLTTYDIGASYSLRDAGTVQLDDVGIRTVSGEIVTYALEGGFKHQIGARDTLLFSMRGSSVTFSSQPNNDYQDITSTATWVHRANRILDMIGLINYYFQDRASNDIAMWRATGGVDARLSPRLSLRGSAGAVYIESSGTPVVPVNGTPIVSGSGATWIADATLTYRLRATTRVSVAVARSVAPDGLGDISQRETISATLTEEVNRRSSLSFATGFSRNGAGTSGGASDNLSASAIYAYRLTPELNANISYRFNQRMSDSGTARSNSILMSVRRSVTVLP